MPLAYEDSLACHAPLVAAQWHPTLNGALVPADVRLRSNKKQWWQCDAGHAWEAVVANRTRRDDGCPKCSGREAVLGKSDLPTMRPLLGSEWHQTKNLKPATSFTVSSGKKAWWECSRCHHEWEAIIASRSRGAGCPACSGNVVICGISDLRTLYPLIADQLHPTKNGDLTAENLAAHSNKRVWWQCDVGHEWQATVHNRTAARGRNCPVCANRLIIIGINDLPTTHPSIAAQLHPTKNGALTAQQLTAGSHKKPWWLCGQGHEYQAVVYSRTSGGTACQRCFLDGKVSKMEGEVTDWIKSITSSPVDRGSRAVLGRKEIDAYLLELKLGIEFHGLYWHTSGVIKDDLYHQRKWLRCREAGVRLIQIWQDDWVERPQQVKQLLAEALGVTAAIDLSAAAVKPMTSSQARNFLTEYHVLGAALLPKTAATGVYLDEFLIAVACWRVDEEAGRAVIDRFAHVPGASAALTLLAVEIVRKAAGREVQLIADNCVADEALLRAAGFVEVEVLAPQQTQLVRNRRHFGDKPVLPVTAHKAVRASDSLGDIWDAGSSRWVLMK